MATELFQNCEGIMKPSELMSNFKSRCEFINDDVALRSCLMNGSEEPPIAQNEK